RPSPQPRSYTVSDFFTSASFSIAWTASSVVGTNGTSGLRGAGAWAAATATVKVVSRRQDGTSRLKIRISSPLVFQGIAKPAKRKGALDSWPCHSLSLVQSAVTAFPLY